MAMTIERVMQLLTPGELDHAKQEYRTNRANWPASFTRQLSSDRTKALDQVELVKTLEAYFESN